MEVEGDRSAWGPQSPHKHQPPVMLAQVCDHSSPFPTAQGQPRARGKGLGSIVTSWVTSWSSLNWHKTNHAYLKREGQTHTGQGSFARGLLSAMDLLFYKPQSPTFSWRYHSLGPASHTRIAEALRQEVPPAQSTRRQLVWSLGGGVTSPPRQLELMGTCFRACLCCVEIYRRDEKRLLRDHPFAIYIQLTNDSNDGL